MNTKYQIITNNPLIKNNNLNNVVFYDTDVLNLFYQISKEVDKGRKILSHPMTSSIRPDIGPYKSVILTEKVFNKVDKESTDLIFKSIKYTEDLYELRKIPIYTLWDDKAKKDFQLIDYTIIKRAIEIEELD